LILNATAVATAVWLGVSPLAEVAVLAAGDCEAKSLNFTPQVQIQEINRRLAVGSKFCVTLPRAVLYTKTLTFFCN